LAVLSCQIADRLGVTCNGSDFESLITAAIPITESFGNATTSRNNNSSRFAKFIELLYTADGYVDGAVINTYLLESVRVIRQGSGERNFHVFYEIFAGLSEEQRVEWSFLSLEDFAYTNQSGEYTRHDDISDFDNFVRLKNAMTKMNLSEFEQEDIFKVLIAVLHIGNICFRESETTGDEGAIFSDTSSDHVRCVCAFTGIEEEDLLRAMTKRTIIVAGSEVHKSLNVTAAGVARDAVAQYLYGLIFDSMIKNVNANVLMNDSSAVASFIGVLDISGFEHFKHNSFEQLCINYTNEKLQDYFNFSVFVSEREVYEREGLHWRCDTYPDNSGMLELFEHKINSIFSLCDELLKVPRPTDDQLFSALVAKCSVNQFFETSKSSRGKGVFTVHHFAVSVQYDSEGFLSKNRNEVASDIVACFAASMRPIMDKMRGGHCHRSALLRRAHSSFQSAPTKSIAVVSKKTVTMASQLRKNLQNLMDKIRLTRSHFIRCVKPNSALSSNSFDYMMAMKQLRCGGALDTLQVFRTGFSNRMEMQFFVTRYALFLTSCGFNALTRRFVDFLKLSRQTGSGRHWKSAALYLIDMLPVTSLIINWLYYGEHDRAQGIALTKDVVHHGLQVGRGQIFCRAHIYESLEVMRRMALDNVAQNLQRRRRARLLISDAQNGRHTALLATQAIIYFSDFRIRKARQHVCATFIIQRQWRVHVAVCARRLFQRSVARIRCAVRRFLAKIKATRQLRLRDIRRSIATRSVQCAWKAYLNRPVKV
jgi:myosin V